MAPDGLPPHELQFIRAAASLFQADITQIVGAKGNGSFIASERSVMGDCTVLYKVADQPEGSTLVKKHRDLLQCASAPILGVGLQSRENWDSVLTTNNQIKRESTSEMVLRLAKKHYSIERSSSKGKIAMTQTGDANSFKHEAIIEVKLLSSMPHGNEIQNRVPKWYVKLDMVPEVPGLDYFRFGDLKEDAVIVAQNMSQAVASDLAELESPLLLHTLDTFTMLVEVVRQLTVEQRVQLEEELFNKEEAMDVYEQALLVTGKLPQKLDTSRGANLLQNLPHFVSNPDFDTLNDLYTRMGHENKSVVNDMVIALSKLVHKAIDMPQPYSGKPDETLIEFITSIIILNFEKSFEQAIVEENSVDVQLYIRALGNTGYKSVLDFFMLCLTEGVEIKPFYQTMIVVSMEKLAARYPVEMSENFIKIFKMRHLDATTRIASFYHIMGLHPSKDLLQELFNVTINDDPILYATVFKTYSAEEDPVMKQHTLEIIKDMDPPTEASPNVRKLSDLSTEKMILHLVQETFVGPTTEDDGRMFHYIMKEFINLNGLKKYISMGGMASKFSRGALSEGLSEPHELYFFVEADNAEAFYSWPTIESGAVHKFLYELYSKENLINFITMNNLALAFPTESGFSFIYTNEVPVFVKVNVNSTDTSLFERNSDIKVYYAVRRQVKLSVINHFEGEKYTVGFDRNQFLDIPIKLTLKDGAKHSVELSPLRRNVSQLVFHDSHQPYRVKTDMQTLHGVNQGKMYPEEGTWDEKDIDFWMPLRVKSFNAIDEDDSISSHLLYPFNATMGTNALLEVYLDDNQTLADSFVFEFGAQRVGLELGFLPEDTLKKLGLVTRMMFKMVKITVSAELTGERHHSALVTLDQYSSLTSDYINYNIKFDVTSLKEQVVAACSQTVISESSVYHDMKLGKEECATNTSMSYEVLANIRSEPLNVTISHTNMPCEVAEMLCSMEGSDTVVHPTTGKSSTYILTVLPSCEDEATKMNLVEKASCTPLY